MVDSTEIEDEETKKFVRTSGVPARLADLELLDMDRGKSVYSTALDRIDELGELISSDLSSLTRCRGTNVVITGGFGTGKTRVAVWLLRRYFETLVATASIQFPRFFRATAVADLRFRRGFAGDDDVEDERDSDRRALERSPLVVIDDVSRVFGHRGDELQVERVVEERYESGRVGTILTMNALPADGRFADFLRYFEVVPLVGESHRG